MSTDPPQLDHTISNEAWRYLLQDSEIVRSTIDEAQAALDALADAGADEDHIAVLQDVIWQAALLQQLREEQSKPVVPKARPEFDQDAWEPA